MSSASELLGGAAVPALILRHADSHPERMAPLYRDGGRWHGLDYRGLAGRVAGVAEGLRRRGLARGDRVVVLVPMSPELYVTLLAVVSLGAVAVFVEPGAGVAEAARAIRLTRPAALVG